MKTGYAAPLDRPAPLPASFIYDEHNIHNDIT